jgi:hypothetical protein
MATINDEKSSVIDQLNMYKKRFETNSENITSNSNYKLVLKDIKTNKPNLWNIKYRPNASAKNEWDESMKDDFFIYYRSYVEHHALDVSEGNIIVGDNVEQILLEIAYKHFMSIQEKAGWYQMQEMLLLRSYGKNIALEPLVQPEYPLLPVIDGGKMYIFNTFNDRGANTVLDLRQFNPVIADDLDRSSDDKILQKMTFEMNIDIKRDEVLSQIDSTDNYYFSSNDITSPLIQDYSYPSSINAPIKDFFTLFNKEVAMDYQPPYIDLYGDPNLKNIFSQLKNEVDLKLKEIENQNFYFTKTLELPDVSYEIEKIEKGRAISQSDEYQKLFDNPVSDVSEYSVDNLPGYKQLIYHLSRREKIYLKSLAEEFYNPNDKSVDWNTAGINPYITDYFVLWLLQKKIIPAIHEQNVKILGHIIEGIRGYVLNNLAVEQKELTGMTLEEKEKFFTSSQEGKKILDEFKSFSLENINFSYKGIPLEKAQNDMFFLTTPLDYDAKINDVIENMENKIQYYIRSQVEETEEKVETVKKENKVENYRSYLIFKFSNNNI